ncbi:MAG: lamin tail domain-containing protein, partial [Limisphaerales bacterium]
ICYDKILFYYRNPVTERWQVIPWDLDLTWAENMYDAGCGGVDRIKQRLLPSSTRFPAVWRAWQNRIREFRDLFWNEDEAARLIDEQAGRLRGPSTGPTLLDADRAQWDYNPRMIDEAYTSAGSSKAGQGRYYRWPRYPSTEVSRDFRGGVQLMKNYIGFRGTSESARARALDSLATDPNLPGRPTLTVAGGPDYPVNGLRLRCSSYLGSAPFGKQRWRIGEITRPGTAPTEAAADSPEPWKYEITPVWESGDLPLFEPEISVPAGVLEVGRTYRARVQFQDAAGRDSRWSAPLEFVAAAPLGTAGIAESLRVSELMYNATDGSTNDFIELHNAGTTALDLGGLQFTQGIDFTIPVGTRLAPGGYLVITKASADGNYAGFRSHYGLASDVAIAGPYSGNFADGGEEVALSAAGGGDVILRFTYSDGRGWPVAADGAGHSLVPRHIDTNQPGDLDYGGNWRISAFLGGSPGRVDLEADTSIVLNEIVAHTDFLSEFDSNDWIELFNRSESPVTFGDGWYLSDSSDQLKRWKIPPGTSLPPRGFAAFDEVTGFNNPRGTGFSINKAGESVYLSHLPQGSPGRVVDAVAFKAQENDWALVRYPDGAGYWDSVGARTRGTSNAGPLGRVVISELLYHEGGIPTNSVPAESLEFIELHNGAPVSTDLHSLVGTWRLNGGVDYQFDQPVTMAPGERILLVSWDPTLVPSLLARFRSLFGIPASVRVFGPYSGRLHNDTDRVALERPQAPDLPGDPITWVIVDEVDYHDSTPWPGGADGSGLSYQRRAPGSPGNDPAAWIAAVPSPGSAIPSGTVDTDGDSMPDAWELEYGLDPGNPGDAQTDADIDGSSNASEYQAGTNPRDAASVLRLNGVLASPEGTMEFTFEAVAGRTYLVEARTDGAGDGWTTIETLPASNETAVRTVRISISTGDEARFIRIRLP